MLPKWRCVVLVPVGGALDPGCEDALLELERRGYAVWRVRGYAAIDAARNQMASDALAQAGGIATTNITFHGDGNSHSQVYVSSNADLDFASSSPTFDFLSGNLNDIQGTLSLNTGSGTHRLMISNESSTVGATNALITRTAAELPGSNPVRTAASTPAATASPSRSTA